MVLVILYPGYEITLLFVWTRMVFYWTSWTRILPPSSQWVGSMARNHTRNDMATRMAGRRPDVLQGGQPR